jgi:hypothetical protein
MEKNFEILREERGEEGEARTAGLSQSETLSTTSPYSTGPNLNTTVIPNTKTSAIRAALPENEDPVPFTSLLSRNFARTARPPINQEFLMKRIRSEISRQRGTNLNMNPSNTILHSSKRTSNPPAPGQLSASRREELLAKLSEERSRVRVAETLDDADVRDVPQVSGGLQIRGAAAKARESLEKRLRSQALLRVRLAREKSRLVVMRDLADVAPAKLELTPARTEAGGDVPEILEPAGVVNEAVDLRHMLREKLLKERLLLARTKVLETSSS